MQYRRGTLYLKIRLKLHDWCIDLSIHLRRLTHERGGLLSKPKASSVNGSKNPLAHCFGRAKQAPERPLFLSANEASP